MYVEAGPRMSNCDSFLVSDILVEVLLIHRSFYLFALVVTLHIKTTHMSKNVRPVFLSSL